MLTSRGFNNATRLPAVVVLDFYCVLRLNEGNELALTFYSEITGNTTQEYQCVNECLSIWMLSLCVVSLVTCKCCKSCDWYYQTLERDKKRQKKTERELMGCYP